MESNLWELNGGAWNIGSSDVACKFQAEEKKIATGVISRITG